MQEKEAAAEAVAGSGSEASEGMGWAAAAGWDWAEAAEVGAAGWDWAARVKAVGVMAASAVKAAAKWSSRFL